MPFNLFVKQSRIGINKEPSVCTNPAACGSCFDLRYATGLSVHEAARQMRFDVSVMCCFSASNMVHVAKTHGHFVMADNDASKTGEQAAIDTGLPWAMPKNVGMDWNDVHATDGLMHVCVALKDLFRKAA